MDIGIWAPTSHCFSQQTGQREYGVPARSSTTHHLRGLARNLSSSVHVSGQWVRILSLSSACLCHIFPPSGHLSSAGRQSNSSSVSPSTHPPSRLPPTCDQQLWRVEGRGGRGEGGQKRKGSPNPRDMGPQDRGLSRVATFVEVHGYNSTSRCGGPVVLWGDRQS